MSKYDQENFQMVIETIKNEIFINSLEETISLNLKNFQIPFTLNQTTYHEMVVLLFNYLQRNNFVELNCDDVIVLEEKIEKLNKEFDDFIKNVEEERNDKMIWIEYESKVCVIKFLKRV